MRLTRVRVPEIAGEMRLGAAAAHHLSVMRLGVGDPALVFDGKGREARAEVLALTEFGGVLKLVEELEGVAETPQPITLAVALLKGDKLADVVRAATELGVARVQLLHTQHADVPHIRPNKLARLARIAEEAAKQSRRTVVPPVLEPVPLRDFAWRGQGQAEQAGQAYVAHPYAQGTLPSQLHWNSPITVLTGPEGGFSEGEVAALVRKGAQAVALGPRILRAETAPVALLGAIVATGV